MDTWSTTPVKREWNLPVMTAMIFVDERHHLTERTIMIQDPAFADSSGELNASGVVTSRSRSP